MTGERSHGGADAAAPRHAAIVPAWRMPARRVLGGPRTIVPRGAATAISAAPAAREPRESGAPTAQRRTAESPRRRAGVTARPPRQRASVTAVPPRRRAGVAMALPRRRASVMAVHPTRHGMLGARALLSQCHTTIEQVFHVKHFREQEEEDAKRRRKVRRGWGLGVGGWGLGVGGWGLGVGGRGSGVGSRGSGGATKKAGAWAPAFRIVVVAEGFEPPTLCL